MDSNNLFDHRNSFLDEWQDLGNMIIINGKKPAGIKNIRVIPHLGRMTLIGI